MRKAMWEEYLEGLQATGGLTKPHTSEVRKFYRTLWAQGDREVAPNQAGLEKSGMQLVWDVGEHHLEVDIGPTGYFDWFYRNRTTGQYEGDQDCVGLSVQLINRYKGLVAAIPN